ncbi:hypothetical protein MTR67_001191 [Solanum verrucosum]|uniref:Uncharacterized protein n=1 Tax=Solanum verrucosum TaxID=315347 RepID=A0AAF0T799_SOLVR|nr:hypothetical protein MTR67_001191 [Solanum verrucosum]
MAPFEALYGRKCRSPIGWFEAGDVKPLGVDLVKKAQDKVRSIQAKLLAAQSRQKKYADCKYEEELVAILDRDVRKLRTKEVKSLKVQWKHRPVEEATWKIEKDMREKYPQLFDNSDCGSRGLHGRKDPMDEKPSYLDYNALQSLKIGRLDLDLAPISSFFFQLLVREFFRRVLGLILRFERMT